MNESDESNARGFYVLSIDGGGFRGFACLLILQHLMSEIVAGTDEEDEPPRPCEIFDLICGTSTGGLIAILLGRLGLSCNEAIAVYKKLGPTIFGESDSGMVWRNIMDGERFSSAQFRKEFEKVVMKYAGNKNALMRPQKNKPDRISHKSTPTFVTVVPEIGAAGVDAHRVRTYSRPRGTVDPAPSDHEWTIFEAARGTTADPMYFFPLDIQVDNEMHVFQDAGASGFNNPAGIAMDEAEKKFGDDAKITLISLGTGLRSLVPEAKLKTGTKQKVKDEDIDKIAKGILASSGKFVENGSDVELARRVAKQLIQVATDTEISHLHLFEQFEREYDLLSFMIVLPVLTVFLRHGGQHENYYRFNPPRGLGDLDLSDYKQGVAIASITDAWLKSPDGRKTVVAARSIKLHHKA